MIQSETLRADTERQTVITRRADVLLEVDRAYFSAQRARAVERVAEETAKDRQLIVDQVTALAASGLKSGLDVSFAKVTFRRTYSSWAHEKGVPAKVVAELMGHAKIDTTLNVYTQVIDASKRAAAEKVGGELFTIVHNSEEARTLTH